MKRSFLHICRDLLATWVNRRSKVSPPTSAAEAMHRGSLIGLLVCVVPAVFAGQAGIVPWVALFGAISGAVIGLLLWVGSDNFDEHVIPPARPGWSAAVYSAPRHNAGQRRWSWPRRLAGRLARSRHGRGARRP